LKAEQSTAGRTLRAVSLAITLVSVITFVTLGYSAYAGYREVAGLSQGGSNPAITSQTTVTGSSATIAISAKVANSGFYSLGLSMACPQGNASANLSCSSTSITIPPGQTQTLRIVINVKDLSQLRGGTSNLHLRGNLTASLLPFASITIKVDLGRLLGPGGA